MVKKTSNFTIFSITIIAIVIAIIIGSIIKINNNYNEKLVYSMESQVEYYAKRCYLEGSCIGEITLKTLYELKYMDKNSVVDPITKEIIDENLKINFVDNKVIIDWNEVR